MNIEFKRYIIDEISKMPFYHVSPNGINHTIKCPYCNDDSPRHGHFCLKIDIDSDEPVLYNCLKCAHGGIMSINVLADLGIYLPQNLAAQLRRSNKIYARKNNLTDISVMPFKIPEVCQLLPITLAQAKMDYINNRLGTKLTIANAPGYNIVLSIKDFMAENKIGSIEGYDSTYLDYIDISYVGFLSANKNCITFRRIHDRIYGMKGAREMPRYIKMVIDRKNIDPNNFYTIPTVFDIMGTNDVNVHVSEGPFDILSIATNKVFATLEPNMFFAVCGFGYTSVIKNIIRMGICPNLNLFVYADNDKSDAAIKKLILPKDQGIVPYLNSFTIVRNGYDNEKDFGVPKDRIKPSYKRIPIIK